MEMKELSAKELIDTARGCAGDLVENACVKCAFHGCTGDCASELLLVLADKLEALSERWIDVKCAVPARDDEYLVIVCGSDKPTVLYFDTEENGFYEEDGDGEPIWYSVTHWAELPSGSMTAGASPRPTVEGGKESVKRCATCAYEDRMADSDRCIECDKHSLWEERK